MKKFLVIALLLSLFVVYGCEKKNKEVAAKTVVKVGLVGENNPQWEYIQKKFAEEGVQIELVKFSEYSLPNQALADKDIDMNAFQHYAYLKNEIAGKKFDLSVIGDTIIAPLSIYSRKITSLDQLKENDKVAIPSDPTNGGRALRLLESAGLITIRSEAGFLPVLSDITSNPKKLQIIEVEAAQTPRLLDDVAISIINGAHAIDAGLFPTKDALFVEKAVSGENPYINVMVVRTADLNNPLYKKILAAYQTDEVAKIIADSFKGAYIPAWK